MRFSKVHKLLLLLLLFIEVINVLAQESKFYPISKRIYVDRDTVLVDSFSINPNSFQLYDQSKKPIDKNNYKLIPITGKVVFKNIPYDTVNFIYQPYSFDFNKEYFIHSSSLNRAKTYLDFNPIYVQNDANKIDFFEENSLNKTGSISRGLMVGNNQNFSLNSNFNLQLSGKISPEIKILASVTDDNIPIQPQGNTQQLQDFDQVYIQVFNDDWKLTTGDFWVKNKDGYFLKYNKRGQGIHLKNSIKKGNNIKITTENSAALSKGKFSRNVIQGVEGNQGPYRLNGAENEAFIIILSGTENVYIDGGLLKRGQNNDYTIDYNTAEITFTANHLITKDKRIIVEFQYSDKNYARSLLQSTTTIKKNKHSFYINAYAEQDSKNQPLQQNIDLEDRYELSQIGDQIEQAITSGVDSINYNDDVNMYAIVDSLGYSIYTHSVDESIAHYQITFSDVGQGNGNYIIKEYNALGKVYEWVAPDTINFAGIVSNGSYAPVKKLITPKKRQVLNLGGSSEWTNKKISYEFSTSNMDLNTFSSLDKKDNVGFAGLIKYNVTKKINANWEVNQEYRIEGVDENFNRIERFRAVEFERNWNIQQLTNSNDQLISSGGLNLNHTKNGHLSYKLNSFLIRNDFSGLKNDVNLKWNKYLFVNFKGSSLETKGIYNSNFLRHKSDVYLPLGSFKLGFKDIHEKNRFYTNDTLDNSSYRFYDWKVYVGKADSNVNNIQFYYQERYDWFKNRSLLKKATHATSPGVTFKLNQNKNFKLNYNLAYRSLNITDTSLTNISPENSLTSRLNYQLKLFKGAIYTTSFLEIGSGLELQKEFIYLEVPAGQGVYTWNDYNGNNIKELNEFEVAIYTDQATYIRIFTPNNNYSKIYSFQYNQSINIDPKKIVKQQNLFTKLLSYFYNQTAINTQKKTDQLDYEILLNPLVDADNITIQQMSNNLRNSTFFNRSSPKYSIEYVTQLFANKNLLINGTDFRATRKEQLKIRWNINKLFMLNTEFNKGFKRNTSTYANSRNFNISENETINKLSYQPNTLFRITLNGRYSEKKNAMEMGDQKAYISDFGISVRRSKREKALVNGELHVVSISYNGQSNSAIGFEMLEGLNSGNNLTWKLSLQKNMSNNVQLSITYNGRKSPNNRTIHTGGMQLRAFF